MLGVVLVVSGLPLTSLSAVRYHCYYDIKMAINIWSKPEHKKQKLDVLYHAETGKDPESQNKIFI